MPASLHLEDVVPVANPSWLDRNGDAPVVVLAERFREFRAHGRGPAASATDRLLARLFDHLAEAERRIELQRRRIAHLETLSMTDELTGIANGRGFTDYLRRTLAAAQRRGGAGVVALLDVDGFKGVNDVHGHAAGDAVLVRIAAALTAGTRLSDFAARLHGDEFAVLLVGADEAQALGRLRAIQDALADQPPAWNGRPVRVSVSFGVASYGPGAEPAALMRRADLAMYRHKRARRSSARGAAGCAAQPASAPARATR